MIQAMVVKLIFKQVYKAINRKHNLKKIDNYVNQTNELDIEVLKINKRLDIIEKKIKGDE